MVGNGATELIHLLPRLKKAGKALIIGPALQRVSGRPGAGRMEM